MKDMSTCIDVVLSSGPVGGADGNLVVGGIDRRDFESLTLGIGLPADANAAAAVFYDLLVEHSDDDTTYMAATANDLIASGGDALSVSAGVISDRAYVFDDGTNGVDIRGDSASVHLGYRGNKRFVRVTVQENGAAAGGTAVIAQIKGHARYAPVD